MWDVGRGEHDTGRWMREETALPSYDAKACGEVHINIHVCICHGTGGAVILETLYMIVT